VNYKPLTFCPLSSSAKTLLSSVMAVIFQVIGLHGGALLGVTYRTSRRISPLTATAISTVQSMPLSGFGGSGSSFASDDPFSSKEGPPQNFQLYRYAFKYCSFFLEYTDLCVFVLRENKHPFIVSHCLTPG
jgi:hypothetical protein